MHVVYCQEKKEELKNGVHRCARGTRVRSVVSSRLAVKGQSPNPLESQLTNWREPTRRPFSKVQTHASNQLQSEVMASLSRISSSLLGDDKHTKVTTVATVAGLSLGTLFIARRIYLSWMKEFPSSDSLPSTNPVKQGFSIKSVSSTNWDVIVIGSGAGGLTTAALLSKEGKKVLVLEQHDIAGGNLHTFSEKGYEFDTGLHYVGGKVGDKSSSVRKQLDYVMDTDVEWEKMDDIYDVAICDEEQFNFCSSWKTLKVELKKKFPEENDAIDKHFQLVQSTVKLFPVFMGIKNLPTPLFRLVMWLFDSKLGVYRKTTKEVLESITSNRKLQGVLSYHYGDYGEHPSRGAFVMHSMICVHYRGGAYYPVGGPLSIAKSIATTIEKHGGKVLVRAPVSSVLVDEKNRAYGVVVKGKEVLAKTIVSSIGAPATFGKLLPESHRHLVSKQLESMKDNMIASNLTLMSMFVGISDPDNSLALPKRNYWIHDSWDHDKNIEAFKKNPTKPPVFFVSFSSAKDPTYSSRNPGKQVALVVGPGFFDHVAVFQNERVKHRGKEYTDMKKEWEIVYMEAFLKQFPELKDKVDYVEFGTALSNDFYLGTNRGAVYGLSHTPERFNLQWLKPKTPIQNFYLTGQDVCSCGITGALVGGYLSAYAISPRCFLRTASLLN